MFDFSFSELMVVAVVALIVIGPEKLPKVARTLGAFMGRIQRYIAQVKDEVNREVRFEELQKLQEEIKTQVNATAAEVEVNLNSHVEAVEQGIEDIALVPQKRKSPKLSQFTQMPAKTAIISELNDVEVLVKKKAVRKTTVKKTADTKEPVKRVTKPKPVA